MATDPLYVKKKEKTFKINKKQLLTKIIFYNNFHLKATNKKYLSIQFILKRNVLIKIIKNTPQIILIFIILNYNQSLLYILYSISGKILSLLSISFIHPSSNLPFLKSS